MFDWKRLVLITVLVMIIDSLWLQLTSESVYMPVLTRIQGQRPNMGARWPAALACWILLAIGIQFYVLDQSVNLTEIMKNSFWFGLIVYGVYNLTTYLTMNQYDLKVAMIDTTWGIVLSLLVSALTFIIVNRYGT